jgi:hypothetical protein
MLNDADRRQGCGNVGEAKEKLNDAEALFGRLKRQVKADYNSRAKSIGAATWLALLKYSPLPTLPA